MGELRKREHRDGGVREECGEEGARRRSAELGWGGGIREEGCRGGAQRWGAQGVLRGAQRGSVGWGDGSLREDGCRDEKRGGTEHRDGGSGWRQTSSPSPAPSPQQSPPALTAPHRRRLLVGRAHPALDLLPPQLSSIVPAGLRGGGTASSPAGQPPAQAGTAPSPAPCGTALPFVHPPYGPPTPTPWPPTPQPPNPHPTVPNPTATHPHPTAPHPTPVLWPPAHG